MSNDLVDQVMKEVMKQMGNEDKPASSSFKANPGITEFVGTAEGDTIGLVIANLDAQVAKLFGLDKKYRSIGILGGRTGAGPQIFAADEAVKATNTEIVKIELPRDTKDGAGHGSLVVFAAEDVSDARRAVEVALEDIDRTFGDVWGNDAGHLEFQYTARASHALNMAFGAPIGKSFGITVGAPAAIGVVLADTAVKASTIDVVSLATPTNGQSFSNEVTATFSGDSGAVRQAIVAAREVGIKLLGALGDTPTPTTTPYI